MSKKTVISASAGSLILGIIIGAAGHSTAKTTTTGAPAAPTGTVTVTAPGAVITKPAAAPAAASTAAPAAKPAVVFTTSGNGIKKTANFTTGGEWSVTYTFDCSSELGGTGNFILSVDGDFGDVLANAMAAKGGDTSYEHDKAGTHYLSVNSECNWTLKVTNG